MRKPGSPSAATLTLAAITGFFFPSSSSPFAVNAQNDAACATPVVPGLYTGTPFTNGLPAVDGSEVTFFKMIDPSGQYVCNGTDHPEADLSLVSYMSLNSTGGRPIPSKIQRAVIVVTGVNRDPNFYMQLTLAGLAAIPSPDNERINQDSVAVISPRFSNGDDKNYGYPWNADGETIEDRAYSPAIVWAGSQWSGGSVNQYPPRTQTVSGFDVLDQLVQYFGNTTTFPNMKQIIVGGHSMGCQMIQRYVAVGPHATDLGVDVPVSYFIGDPNSWAWLDSDRPLSLSKCPADEYNLWREGLDDYASYGADNSAPITYGAHLVAQGPEAVVKNYMSKPKRYERSIRDQGDESSSCSPFTTGQDRNERFFEYTRVWTPDCSGGPESGNCDTVDYVDAGHDAPTIFASDAGRQRLFVDNFDGDGDLAPDFGYPRRARWDDPWPDEEQVSSTGGALMNEDATAYDGGMTYRGCWSDVDNAQTNASLPTVIYQGADNTRLFCAGKCSAAGYAIAGVREDLCYCGNGMSSEAREIVSTSCDETCPGNSTVLCGGVARLSVMSSKDLDGEVEGFR